MIVEHGSYEKRQKLTTVKNLHEFFKWYDKWIKGKQNHWYTRINFFEDCWEIDYGSYSSFLYLTDLPENCREELDAIYKERQKND